MDEVVNVEPGTKKVQIGTLLLDFLRPQPLTGCILEPGLLLRHAAGRLFQEANLIVERTPIEQLHFPGLAPYRGPTGRLERDIRFTPATLARTLVERSLDALPQRLRKFSAFDPACGSGVFLLEVVRELHSRDFSGEVTVSGFDVSDISCLLAKFCLNRAAFDNKGSKLRIQVNIEQKDALAGDWPEFDVVLMNPPFVPWERMNESMRDIIRKVLGDLSQGRSDKAMAFVWKAVQHLVRGKAVGTVIPAPVLETRSGERWRDAIAALAEIRLLGKFHGFGYFPASQVEPAFLVLVARGSEPSRGVKVLLAEANREDECLRALRLGVETMPGAVDGWEIYSTPLSDISPANWMPRSQSDLALVQGLERDGFAKVGELFDVRQGIRAGHACFVINQDEFDSLQTKERPFFRPSATNASIREGRIFPGEWVFYPYSKDGPTITNETDLQTQVPTYFQRKLKPFRSELQRRAGTDRQYWWLLTRERGWQHDRQPKMVSTYFGGRGRFAWDKTGEFVVVQGHAWFWRKVFDDAELEGEKPERWFSRGVLPLEYLAIFNSLVFDRLLALFCPRVQGGQFDLSKRFVDKVPIPDLSNAEASDANTCAALGEMGRRIHSPRDLDLDHLG